MFINTDSKFIWMNGEFLKWDETKVHALTHTLHYGVGVFEGVRAYKNDLGGAIFRLDDHTRRLFDAASKVNIDIPYSIDDLNQIQKDTLKQNKLEEAYIRPIVFYGSEELGLRAKRSLSKCCCCLLGVALIHGSREEKKWDKYCYLSL